jgi:hypothetical protein
MPPSLPYQSHLLYSSLPSHPLLSSLSPSLPPSPINLTPFSPPLPLLPQIAEYYDTTNALHLSTIFKMFAIWLFVSFPLTVVGTMFGRHWGGKSDFPCRVNSMARPIPKGPWYVDSSKEEEQIGRKYSDCN